MAKLNIEKNLYGDLEKFHRVIGYYEGQKIKPLQMHEKHISEGLEKNFRSPEHYIRRLQFDLFLQHVLSEDRKIFETDKPESTLLYLLFAEGIKSLVLLRDLMASEMKDWCLLVRETLVALDSGSSKDLASVLWKTPFRNLRARIYNSLMDLRDQRKTLAGSQTTDLQPTEDLWKKMEESPGTSTWHNRDSEWDVPSAENLFRDSAAAQSIPENEILGIRNRLTQTAMDVGSNEILKISDLEIELLSGEMSSYDQNQAEFNLLAWDVSVLQGSFGCDPAAEDFIAESLKTLAGSFMSRFHPGLILHLMQQMEQFVGARYLEIRDQLRPAITAALASPENQRRLLDSMKDPTRSSLARKLLPYVDQKQFPGIIDYYLENKDVEGLLVFLEMIFKRGLAMDEILMGFGEARLSQLLPHFGRLSWENKLAFLVKALRSKFPEVVRQASQFLPKLPIRADHALDIFRKLPEDIQEIWLKQLKAQVYSEWSPFVEGLAASNYWTQMNERLILGWVEVFFKYLGPKTFPILNSWIADRKVFLWPKHPRLRETILNAALEIQQTSLLPYLNVWIKREAKVRFQDPWLKDRLSRRASKIP